MRKIITSRGQEILVDANDFEYLNQWKWQVGKDGHARRTGCKDGKYYTIRMSRLIMNAPDHLEVDHINRNPLDNRRSNLRLATREQNAKNIKKSGGMCLPGVRYRFSGSILRKNKDARRYEAEIRVNGKRIGLGKFMTEEEAHNAYCAAVKKYHGEFGNVG